MRKMARASGLRSNMAVLGALLIVKNNEVSDREVYNADTGNHILCNRI